MTAPLHSLRVLDLSRVLAGPLCGQILADLGADVIKIERPDGGDETRHSNPKKGGESGYFMSHNRNKRGITLDLKAPEGREVFLHLVRSADVVVENYRPGTMNKLGLGSARLLEVNPKLIYASISGFGAHCSRSGEGGYDIIAQAESGMMATTGWPGGKATRTGAALTDVLAAHTAVIAILAALHRRQSTGRGGVADIALLDCAALAMSALYAFEQLDCPAPGLEGNRYALSCPFNSFAARDGDFVLGASNDKLWAGVCRALGRPDLISHPDYCHNPDRVAHHGQVKEAIEAVTSRLPLSEVIASFKAQGVPAAPISSPKEATESAFLRDERDMFPQITHPTAGTLRLTGSSVKLDGHSPALTPSPLLGQHNSEVAAQLPPAWAQDENFLRAAGLLTGPKDGVR